MGPRGVTFRPPRLLLLFHSNSLSSIDDSESHEGRRVEGKGYITEEVSWVAGLWNNSIGTSDTTGEGCWPRLAAREVLAEVAEATLWHNGVLREAARHALLLLELVIEVAAKNIAELFHGHAVKIVLGGGGGGGGSRPVARQSKDSRVKDRGWRARVAEELREHCRPPERVLCWRGKSRHGDRSATVNEGGSCGSVRRGLATRELTKESHYEHKEERRGKIGAIEEKLLRPRK